jgi:capsular exopolysaccharide synthesis family protein
MTDIPFEETSVRFDLANIMRLLWRRKRMILLAGIGGALISFWISLYLTPSYQAEGNLVVRSEALTTPDNEKAFGSVAVNEAVVTTEHDVLRSIGLLRRAAARVDIPPEFLAAGMLSRVRTGLDQVNAWFAHVGLPMIPTEWFDSIPPVDSSAEGLQQRETQFVEDATTVLTTKGSSVIRVRAVTHDAALSAAIVNAILQLYMEDRTDEETRTAKSIDDALRSRLRQTTQQIEQAQSQLTSLYREPGAVENSEIPGQWQRLTLLGVELVKAQSDLARLKASYNPEALARAKAQVASLEAQMTAERQNRTSQFRAQIAVNAGRDRLASLWRVSDELQAKLIDLAAHPKSLNARILSLANVPLKPSFPNKVLFGVGGFLTASMACLLALVHFRGHRPQASEVARMMQAPLLGGLPQIAGPRSAHRLFASAFGKPIKASSDTLYAVALGLEDAIKDGKVRIVTVTSAWSGEGKTTVSAGIGRILASIGIRVLLIDLDLRRPSVERVVLLETPEPDNEQIVGPHVTLNVRVDRKSGLHILTPSPVGCDDTLSYLRSSELRTVIEMTQDRYDLLLFDTPPVMAVPDALFAARLADAIVLVAEEGRSSSIEAAEVSRRLATTRRPICGVIATKLVTGDTLAGAFNGYGRK